MPDFSSSQPVRASVETENPGGIVNRETELLTAIQRLTHANNNLKHVVLVTGHDLQEPIRTINTACEHILEEGAAPVTLRSILTGASRLREIVQALLSYSVVTAPKDVAWASTCRETVCREVEFRLATEIAETGARIVRNSLPTICCDRDGMVQVFKNLIGNAIKYRRHGVVPVIRISAEQNSHGDHWLITVTDNGIGFDASYAERIFDPFRRLHGNEVPGTGIGLTICRSIVEQHGGKISAQGSLETGSTFCFTLPCTS